MEKEGERERETYIRRIDSITVESIHELTCSDRQPTNQLALVVVATPSTGWKNEPSSRRNDLTPAIVLCEIVENQLACPIEAGCSLSLMFLRV